MATNPYFNYAASSEQDLYEDLITESIKNFGQDIYYIPREVVHRDMIFDDTVLSQFNYAYKVEVYLESVEGFDGDGDLFSKFGVEIRDAVTFIISRRRWNTEIRNHEEPITGSTVGGNKDSIQIFLRLTALKDLLHTSGDLLLTPHQTDLKMVR